MQRRRRVIALLGPILVTTGLAVMSWPVVTWVYGLYWQERLARSFPQETAVSVQATVAAPLPTVVQNAPVKRSKPRKQTPSKPKPLRAGEAFARLRIGRIGLSAIVVEGADRLSLRKGPGHLSQTGRPGERRNCAIAAHRDAWFERLHEVRPGDTVWVESTASQYEYVVAETRVVTPDRGDLLNRGAVPVLTLITCTGPGYPRSRYRLLVFCNLRTTSSRQLTAR